MALPYLWMFEAGGAVVESVGYVVMVVAFVTGRLNASYFVLFLLLAMAYGVALSVSALLIDQTRATRSQSTPGVVWLLACTVLENFGYRQMVTIWRFMATVEVLAGRKATWEPLERKGFDSG